MSGWFRWVIKDCRKGREALYDNDVEVYVLMYEGCGTQNIPAICIYYIYIYIYMMLRRDEMLQWRSRQLKNQDYDVTMSSILWREGVAVRER